MGEMKKITAVVCSLFFLTILSGFQLSPVNAADLLEEMSTEDTIYIRGIISSVSPEKMQIAVRPPKSDRIVITIGPDTVLEGVKQIDELVKKQQVKIWYSPATSKNRAVKIKKIMELGC